MLVAASLLTPLIPFASALEDDVPLFDAPVLITAGGASVDELLYPTPVLQDVDGDGKQEMIVGDLIGNFWVARRAAEGGDTAWTALENLEANGEPLRLHNW